MTDETKVAGDTTPAETNEGFKFRMTLNNEDKIILDIGKDPDSNINDIIGVAMHIVYDGSKKVYDTMLAEHPEFDGEMKDNELLNIIAYSVVSTQMVMYGVIEQVFGKVNKEMLNAKLAEANDKLSEFITNTMNKAASVQDKVVGELTKDEFGDHHPTNDGPEIK